MTIDPNLIAEWLAPDGTRMILQTDSSMYSGTVDVPYFLEDSGNVLTINNKSYYTRVPGSAPTLIIGQWRDVPNGEEITYRADGRYISISDGDPLVYFGIFTASPTTLSSYEYRGTCTTDGDQITFDSIFSTSQSGPYTVTADTLTVQLDGVTTVYRKVV
jgi:hypothetical protein